MDKQEKHQSSHNPVNKAELVIQSNEPQTTNHLYIGMYRNSSPARFWKIIPVPDAIGKNSGQVINVFET